MQFKSTSFSRLSLLAFFLVVIAVQACQASSSAKDDESANGGNGGEQAGGQGGEAAMNEVGGKPGAGGTGATGGSAQGGSGAMTVIVGGSAGGGGNPSVVGGAGGQAPGAGGSPMSTDFCKPANYRPFARDGFLDAAKNKVQQGTDYVRGIDPTITKGELVNVTFAGGTVSLYVPAAYEKAQDGKVGLMIFSSGDGSGYKDDVTYRIVDNLIKAGEIPVMLLAFLPTSNKQEIEGNPAGWADGLATKMFPAIKAKFGKVSSAANMHGMTGGSSWGLGAFHAAWYKPDFMGKVLAHSGSFVCFGALRDYAKSIRSETVRPIRVAMTVGHCDLVGGACSPECETVPGWCSMDASSCHANWSDVNVAMAGALKDKGYAHRLIRGFGGHTISFWTSMLADDLRWLWRPEVCP